MLIWRLSPETEEKFPAYHTSKSDSKKDSKIVKAARYIKERLTALDQWRPVKNTKPHTNPQRDITEVNYRVHNVGSLSVFAPKNEASFSTGDFVEIQWREFNLPICTGMYPRKTYLISSE